MESKKQRNSFDEIIAFDDEYCEEADDEIHPPPEQPSLDINLPPQKDLSKILNEIENHNDNISDEDNIIYDPRIRELNEIDINNKQAIIDILMDDKLISKKPIKNDELFKEKNKIKFSYVKSAITRSITEEPEQVDKKNYSTNYTKIRNKNNFKKGNPELIEDINIAASLLKDDIAKENKDVALLLFNDKNKYKIKKKLSSEEISQKIKLALENKKKNLQEIEDRISKKKEKQETFSPTINHRKKDGGRRDLNTFLKSMDEFQKKKEDKYKEDLKTKEDEIKKLYIGKPQVNKNSEKLVKRKSVNEPAFKRLYDKRINNVQKMKDCEEKKLLQEKEEEKKRKEIEYQLKKNDQYKHIKPKVNSFIKKTQSQIDLLNSNNTNNPRQNSIPKKMKRVKSAININKYSDNNINNKTKTNLELKDIESNKILFNKFLSNFNKAFNLLRDEINNPENNLQELDIYEYHKLLYDLNIVTYPPEKLEEKEHQITKNDKEDEIGVKIEENKLINDSFDLLKLKRKKVKLNNVKNFLICALGMQNYNLYQIYIDSHEQELKNLFPLSKYKKEEIPELIVIKQNEELLSNLSKKCKTNKNPNKYYKISKNKEMIFTSENASNIKKDFSIFGVNYRKQKRLTKEEKLLNKEKKQFTFKPKIGEKSNQLYQKYKDRVLTLHNDSLISNLNINNNSIFQKTNVEYLNRVLLLEQKKQMDINKIREEKEQKQKQECTFKPKISQYDPKKKGKYDDYKLKYNTEINQDKNSNNLKKKNSAKNKNIFIELYENGIQKLKAKKDKTKEQVELEEQKSEYTFQPKIESLDIKKVPKTKFNNDIYNEKDYQILYNRLKHGRLERMVRNSSTERYGLNDELKKYVKDIKNHNYIKYEQYFNPDGPFFYNSIELNYINKSLNQIEQEYNNNSIEIIEKKNQKIKKEDNDLENYKTNANTNNIYNDDKKDNDKIAENSINNKKVNQNQKVEEIKEEKKLEIIEPKKREELPLLIIDVSIKDGVKKKIYVYEGDTADNLAENFAKENNLEIEVKNKLKTLIHNHMVRLLTRIDEENQASSAKFNKNN